MRIQSNITNYSNPQFKGLYVINGKEKDLCKFRNAWSNNYTEGSKLSAHGKRVPENIINIGGTIYIGGLSGDGMRNASLLVATNEDYYVLQEYRNMEFGLARGMREKGIQDPYSERGINFKLGAIMALYPNIHIYNYDNIQKDLKKGNFNMVTGMVE